MLETIKNLIFESYQSQDISLLPLWLKKVLLGSANPEIAHYSKIETFPYIVNFPNTFINKDHVKECFDYDNISIKFNGNGNNYSKIEFVDQNNIIVHCTNLKQLINNNIRYTKVQIEAIKSGTLKGLTMIVGPPGTGKTDIAAKILTNLYSIKDHQTVILAHSNQALNQIFENLIKCGVDEKHLLRLGHGEECLDTSIDFSRKGRIDYILNRRLQLLEYVGILEESLNISKSEHTCESAFNFYKFDILNRILEFEKQINLNGNSKDNFIEYFPFKKYFSFIYNIPWEEQNISIDYINECFENIKNLFLELNEYRAFELITTVHGRSNYILVKMAKIIAMTCTYASLRRSELIEMGLQYDSVLIEESAQVLEIETFIPLVLQKDSNLRLKRLILIGDHHQLPPVIKNMPLKQFSNIDQSMFQRLIRLGVNCIQLDSQGRCRSSIYNLIKFQYEKLIGNLPHVSYFDSFKNPGFAHDYQFINVQQDIDSNGNLIIVEESEPLSFYYQNETEAEYAVSLFIYMRLIGYSANSISILAMYNGQKRLIRDILQRRCANNPILGMPFKVTTVDRYQGQQNDYVIVSLTRTKSIGYLRDFRRLVVAFSRGRFGLWVLGNLPLFSKYDDFKMVMQHFEENPFKLELYPNESFKNQQDQQIYPFVRTNKIQPTIVETSSDMLELSKKLYMERFKQLEEEYQKNLEIEKQRMIDQENEVNPEESAINSGDGETINNEISEDLS